MGMRYALLASGTTVVMCILIILALLSKMIHVTSTCTWRTTLNPVDMVGMQVVDVSPPEAIRPMPIPGIKVRGPAPKEFLDGKE